MYITHLILIQPYELGNIIIPIVQMTKVRLSNQCKVTLLTGFEPRQLHSEPYPSTDSHYSARAQSPEIVVIMENYEVSFACIHSFTHSFI